MFSRRAFLKYTGGTALTLFASGRLGGPRQALAQIEGGSLDPLSVPKYTTPLLIPPVMPRAGTVVLTGGKNADYYEISMKQFAQQILPAALPAPADPRWPPAAHVARIRADTIGRWNGPPCGCGGFPHCISAAPAFLAALNESVIITRCGA